MYYDNPGVPKQPDLRRSPQLSSYRTTQNPNSARNPAASQNLRNTSPITGSDNEHLVISQIYRTSARFPREHVPKGKKKQAKMKNPQLHNHARSQIQNNTGLPADLVSSYMPHACRGSRIPLAAAELVELAAVGEDDESDLRIAEDGELVRLLEQTVPALGEGHLPVDLVLDPLQLDPSPPHGGWRSRTIDLLPPAGRLPTEASKLRSRPPAKQSSKSRAREEWGTLRR
jgi:hypothetical protein